MEPSIPVCDDWTANVSLPCSVFPAPTRRQAPHEDLKSVLGPISTFHLDCFCLFQDLLLLVNSFPLLYQSIDVLVYLLQQFFPVQFLLLLLLLIITESCFADA